MLVAAYWPVTNSSLFEPFCFSAVEFCQIEIHATPADCDYGLIYFILK